MLRFSVTASGDKILDRAFNRITDKIADFRDDVWPAAAEAFWIIEKEQFESGGAKGASGKWPDLSPKYEEWRAKHFNPFPFPLHRTGDLKASLTRKGAKGNIYDARPQELTLGSSIEYGGYHMKPYKRRPARPPISLSEKQKRDLVKAMQKVLVHYARKQGFTETEIDRVA